MKLKFLKLYNVKSPSIGTRYSAGIDFYIPEYSDEYASIISKIRGITISDDKRSLVIEPHGKAILPSGIKLSFWNKVSMRFMNVALIFFNKSGIASKKQLIVGGCVDDVDYRDEVVINVINTSIYPITIDFGQKIIQGILIPIFYVKLLEVKNEKQLYKGKATRFGGFGSTGVK